MTRSGAVSKSLMSLRPGWPWSAVSRMSSPMRKAASGREIFLRLARHSCHWRGFLGKGIFDQFGHFLVLLPDGAEVITPDELGVALLLPGDDLVDNHRTAGGDGFLDSRAAGLGDDEVVAHHQFRASGSSSRGLRTRSPKSRVRSMSLARNSGSRPAVMVRWTLSTSSNRSTALPAFFLPVLMM